LITGKSNIIGVPRVCVGRVHRSRSNPNPRPFNESPNADQRKVSEREDRGAISRACILPGCTKCHAGTRQWPRATFVLLDKLPPSLWLCRV